MSQKQDKERDDMSRKQDTERDDMSQKQDKERDDMSQKQDTERDDPYVRRRNREPTNCSPGDTVQDDEPYKKAKRYIERNPASHCCTIK